METFRHFQFSVIRYVPDIQREEFINIGILICDVSEVRSPLARFTTNWERVRVLDPDADLETLQALQQDLNAFLGEASGAASIVSEMLKSFSSSLELTPLKGRTAESIDILAEELMKMYVNPRSSSAVLRMQGAG